MKKILSNKSARLAIMIFASGLIMPLLIGYFIHKGTKLAKHNIPYISLADYVKNNTTKGHLWFEELIAGDEGIVLKKDILPLFEKSKRTLLTAKNTGDSEIGYFEKQDDNKLNVSFSEAILKLDELIRLTNERYRLNIEAKSKTRTDSNLNVQNAGGSLDLAFDEVYEDIQLHMEAINKKIRENIETENNKLTIINWILIIIVGLVSIVVGILIFKFQTKNEKLITANKEKLEHENKRHQALSHFVNKISEGQYTGIIDENFASDELGIKLEELKGRLKTNQEEEEKRNWTNLGLAKIGEILRNSTLSDANNLYNNVLSFTVKYLNITQGALFIVNDDNESDKYLQMASCFAYEKRKFADKRIEIGEGLVGQCYLERDYFMLTEIPDKYTHITSGLGDATPNCLIVVPLKIDDQINGIMELASFKVFEEYQINFILKLAESIASTITSLSTNQKTSRLLIQTQQLTEEMRSQEEELRQNLEEMLSTQEEFQRKEKEYELTINGLKEQLN